MLAMANANYERGIKEQEVASRMPAQELELRRLEIIVDGMKHFGQAAWRHPDEMQSLMNQLKPFLRIGPVSVDELTSNELRRAASGRIEKPQLPGMLL
jgi:hypothetical protein